MKAFKAQPLIFDAKRLELVFAQCFSQSGNTVLVGGYDEPLYQPAEQAGQLHSLRYREDFFASALHESAHWCIAGRERRKQVDFGYWYAPDGRTPAQQKAFENVEYQPQALEWFFSKACGYPFRISADNLNGEVDCHHGFKVRVVEQANRWCESGLPHSAAIFFSALCREFSVADDIRQLSFSLLDLK